MRSAEIEARVEQNYDRGLLEQTILNALVAAGKDPDARFQ